MGTLVSYEVKKILKKKSTLVAFIILFALHLVAVCISGSLGTTYVDGEFYETHYERNKIDRANGIALSGRRIDEELLTEMSEAYQKVDWSTPDYMWTDTYREEVRKYSDLETRFKVMGLWGNALSEVIAEKMVNQSTTEKVYTIRKEVQQQAYDGYMLLEQDIVYWQEKDAEIEVPFTYEYASGFDSMLGGQGIYMVCMLLTFFIAISMVSVFAEEHSRKTDQLILCARYGKDRLYIAKLVAGSLVVFAINILFVVTAVIGKTFSYGPEGFRAALQLITVYWYPYALSVGETTLIAIGLLCLSSVMVTIFTMLLAEVLKNSVGAMAIVTGGLFVARLVSIPPSMGIFSQLWSYLPINILKIDEGFTDLRLVHFFGTKLTTWQFAPILYLILIGVMVWGGSKVYKNYQVSGR